MKYLLDTTWVVEYLRGNEEIIKRTQQLQEQGLAVSIISVAELYEGVFRSNAPEKNEAALNDFLKGVSVQDVTHEVSRTYGQIRAELLQKGLMIGAIDVLLAATTIAANLTLLTADRDFERIEPLRAEFFG